MKYLDGFCNIPISYTSAHTALHVTVGLCHDIPISPLFLWRRYFMYWSSFNWKSSSLAKKLQTGKKPLLWTQHV